jgi:hypothetical protein
MTKWIPGGAVLGLIAMLVAVIAMGAGHGTNVPGCILVPWAMLALFAREGNALIFALGFIQYPVYAALVGYRRVMAIPVLLVHIAAVAGVLLRNGSL